MHSSLFPIRLTTLVVRRGFGLGGLVRSERAAEIELLALRHEVAIFRCRLGRPAHQPVDRAQFALVLGIGALCDGRPTTDVYLPHPSPSDPMSPMDEPSPAIPLGPS
jgi:hypothetical protein